MATVTGYTAARMDEIIADNIIDAHIVGDELILTTRDATEINVGSVRGDPGAPGGTGPAGPAGPSGIVVPILEAEFSTALHTASFLTDIGRSNVPVTAGNAYAVHLHTQILFKSLSPSARWEFWMRINGVDSRRMCVIAPAVTGTLTMTIDATVYWYPTVTQATDDVTVYALEAVSGADLQMQGDVGIPRTFSIVDLGNA